MLSRAARAIARRIRERVNPIRPEMLMHAIGRRAPRIPCGLTADLTPDASDVAMAERLLTAYRLAASEARDAHGGEDVWTFTRGQQQEYLQILEHGEPESLAKLLCNMSRHDATIGTVQGNHEYHKIRSNPAYRDWLALHTKDKLVSLAEAVGAIPCENPEQGVWGSNLHLDIAHLVGLIEKALGMSISPPPIDGGLLKINSTMGSFSERDLNALYTAWTIQPLIAETGATAITEIGAGSGRVVYWNWRFGIRRLATYDLPHINVLQSFYLHKSAAGIPLVLYGEAEVSGPRVAIRPYFRFHHDGEEPTSLLLNQDSFPEIHAESVRGYLRDTRQRKFRHFLSINHESRPPSPISDAEPQLNVPDLIAGIGGYHRLKRSLYWLRRGYVAEFYAVDPSP